MQEKSTPLFKVIGPGLLFAGSAVGVSHLVQSTRAGAGYGMALVVFIVLAFIAKYPSFMLAPRYSAVTGRPVLASYRQQGPLAMAFYGLSTFTAMFIGVAANLLVTAGLLLALFPVELSPVAVAAIISSIAISLLVMGHYHLLEIIMRCLMAFLTIATIVATVMAFPMIDWTISGAWLPEQYDIATILFLAALVGWMPTPTDVSVWQSQWTVAKIRDSGYQPSLKEATLDFNVGYITTLLLAFCFVILGTAVVHSAGKTLVGNPAEFAAGVIGLYEHALGKWSGSLVGIAAVAVMLSTLLTIMDGFPRGAANFLLLLQGQEEGVNESEADGKRRHRYYWVMLVIMVLGGLAILQFFSGQFTAFVDFGATAAFLSAPFFALLNYRAMLGEEIPQEARLGKGLHIWSIAGIVLLFGFAFAYIYFALLR